MRNKAVFQLADGQYKDIKNRMLNWVSQFSILLLLDNNDYSSTYNSYEYLVAVGAEEIIGNENEDPLISLQKLSDKRDWLFGHICYDFKNLLETKLSSRHAGKIGFPLVCFFCPQIVCYIDNCKSSLIIESLYLSPRDIYNDILNTANTVNDNLPKINFHHKIKQPQYLETISRLRQHIKDGDCYEINYCGEGFCENVYIEPIIAYDKLNSISPAPFAAYYRLEDKYMMCASPERYLKKAKNNILTQPIKGTARRDENEIKDKEMREALHKDIKERAENVMIVDLMRNDLARFCEVGSVHVDELFGIYSFPQVHQMISTVSGALKRNIPFTDTFRYSFPMGSMTGAPKVKVMQLIDKYEQSARELFSGTVGYITPQGDFDFNVIIRSLFYNSTTSYLSYQTGGAITYDSDPEKEWEEMRLKAWALERIFS
ncbi:MAG TPA: chorismate-binding protein [Flavipsychrobacter sp.]|nr:chorismate-binding protein [Flavipsychrobacter sp.]